MSNNVKVRPQQVGKAVMKALAEYGDDVLDMLEAETKNSARETSKALKAASPVGKKGSYARGWSHKAQKGGPYQLTETVYNRTDYQLTHLLEKPHSTGPGRVGHYPKNVDYTGHIARTEEEYTNKYYEEVLAKL